MTILIFIAVLAVLILAHEFGHFWAAKKSGCTVEEFGIGFPPRLFTVKRGETVYSINLLPFGGFVKIKGENGDENPDEKSFVSRSFGWKSLIIAAGVLMNVALAYVLITANLVAGVPVIVDEGENFGRFARLTEQKIATIELLPGSPAEVSGLQIGDTITSINGQAVTSVDEAIRLISSSKQSVEIRAQRNGSTFDFNIQPKELPELSKRGIGIGLSQTADLSYPWYVSWWYGAQRTATTIKLIIVSFAELIANLFRSGRLSAEVAGPIGIAVLTGEVAKLGLTHLIQFTALLSLNLAVINILPFPALDGGRLALILMERLRGKKMRVQIEQWIQIAGFAFLILLMVAVTARDIGKYGSGIWQSITNLLT